MQDATISQIVLSLQERAVYLLNQLCDEGQLKHQRFKANYAQWIKDWQGLNSDDADDVSMLSSVITKILDTLFKRQEMMLAGEIVLPGLAQTYLSFLTTSEQLSFYQTYAATLVDAGCLDSAIALLKLADKQLPEAPVLQDTLKRYHLLKLHKLIDLFVAAGSQILSDQIESLEKLLPLYRLLVDALNKDEQINIQQKVQQVILNCQQAILTADVSPETSLRHALRIQTLANQLQLNLHKELHALKQEVERLTARLNQNTTARVLAEVKAVAAKKSIQLPYLAFADNIQFARQQYQQAMQTATSAEAYNIASIYSHQLYQAGVRLLQACMQFLPEPPCEFCFLIGGSVTRRQALLGSDFDMAGIVTADQQFANHPYFKELLGLLHEQMKAAVSEDDALYGVDSRDISRLYVGEFVGSAEQIAKLYAPQHNIQQLGTVEINVCSHPLILGGSAQAHLVFVEYLKHFHQPLGWELVGDTHARIISTWRNALAATETVDTSSQSSDSETDLSLNTTIDLQTSDEDTHSEHSDPEKSPRRLSVTEPSALGQDVSLQLLAMRSQNYWDKRLQDSAPTVNIKGRYLARLTFGITELAKCYGICAADPQVALTTLVTHHKLDSAFADAWRQALQTIYHYRAQLHLDAGNAEDDILKQHLELTNAQIKDGMSSLPRLSAERAAQLADIDELMQVFYYGLEHWLQTGEQPCCYQPQQSAFRLLCQRFKHKPDTLVTVTHKVIIKQLLLKETCGIQKNPGAWPKTLDRLRKYYLDVPAGVLRQMFLEVLAERELPTAFAKQLAALLNMIPITTDGITPKATTERCIWEQQLQTLLSAEQGHQLQWINEQTGKIETGSLDRGFVKDLLAQNNLFTFKGKQTDGMRRTLPLVDHAAGNYRLGHGGTDYAAAISNGHALAYVKLLPEQPTKQKLHDVFTQKIVGNPLQMTLGKLAHNGKTYPVVISKTVGNEHRFHGRNLQTDVDLSPGLTFDSYHYTLLVLTSLLLMVEDGKQDNYAAINVQTPFGIKDGALGFDSDHLLQAAIEEEDEQHQYELKLKSVLFCLDQMLDKPDDDAVKHFLSLDPQQVLQTTFSTLETFDQTVTALFSDKEIKEYLIRPSEQAYLRTSFEPGVVRQFVARFNQMQTVLRTGRAKNLLDIMHHVDNRAAMLYAQVLKQKDKHPSKRFTSLPLDYNQGEDKKGQTRFKSRAVVKDVVERSIHAKRSFLQGRERFLAKAVDPKCIFGLEQAITEMQLECAQWHQVTVIRQRLLRGEPALLDVDSDAMANEVMRGLRFDLLRPYHEYDNMGRVANVISVEALERNIIEQLKICRFRFAELDLSHAKTLSNDDLKYILFAYDSKELHLKRKMKRSGKDLAILHPEYIGCGRCLTEEQSTKLQTLCDKQIGYRYIGDKLITLNISSCPRLTGQALSYVLRYCKMPSSKLGLRKLLARELQNTAELKDRNKLHDYSLLSLEEIDFTGADLNENTLMHLVKLCETQGFMLSNEPAIYSPFLTAIKRMHLQNTELSPAYQKIYGRCPELVYIFNSMRVDLKSAIVVYQHHQMHTAVFFITARYLHKSAKLGSLEDCKAQHRKPKRRAYRYLPDCVSGDSAIFFCDNEYRAKHNHVMLEDLLELPTSDTPYTADNMLRFEMNSFAEKIAILRADYIKSFGGLKSASEILYRISTVHNHNSIELCVKVGQVLRMMADTSTDPKEVRKKLDKSAICYRNVICKDLFSKACYSTTDKMHFYYAAAEACAQVCLYDQADTCIRKALHAAEAVDQSQLEKIRALASEIKLHLTDVILEEEDEDDESSSECGMQAPTPSGSH